MCRTYISMEKRTRNDNEKTASALTNLCSRRNRIIPDLVSAVSDGIEDFQTAIEDSGRSKLLLGIELDQNRALRLMRRWSNSPPSAGVQTYDGRNPSRANSACPAT